MPTVERVARTDTGLASELRLSVMRLRRRLANEREPGNQLSIASMSVLASLFRYGHLTVGELAANERVQPPSMTRHVNALEEDGYVARRAHETDGRVVVVELTDAGPGPRPGRPQAPRRVAGPPAPRPHHRGARRAPRRRAPAPTTRRGELTRTA